MPAIVNTMIEQMSRVRATAPSWSARRRHAEDYRQSMADRQARRRSAPAIRRAEHGDAAISAAEGSHGGRRTSSFITEVTRAARTEGVGGSYVARDGLEQLAAFIAEVTTRAAPVAQDHGGRAAKFSS